MNILGQLYLWAPTKLTARKRFGAHALKSFTAPLRQHHTHGILSEQVSELEYANFIISTKFVTITVLSLHVHTGTAYSLGLYYHLSIHTQSVFSDVCIFQTTALHLISFPAMSLVKY